MENGPDKDGWKLLTVIVDFGQGTKVLRLARQQGVSGGTILLGEGTVGNHMYSWLDLQVCSKEIVIMTAGKETADSTLDHLNKELKMNSRNHGIAFLVSVKNLFGSRRCNPGASKNPMGGIPVMYQTIIVIVDKGMADTVVDAAEKAGAHGATIINARGSGVYETIRLFNMDVEPEKELVLILAKTEISESISNAIRRDAHLDEPGAGIMFALDVERACGLFEK